MRGANYFAWSPTAPLGTHNPLVAGSSPARPTKCLCSVARRLGKAFGSVRFRWPKPALRPHRVHISTQQRPHTTLATNEPYECERCSLRLAPGCHSVRRGRKVTRAEGSAVTIDRRYGYGG
jgi:hypothetical protein